MSSPYTPLVSRHARRDALFTWALPAAIEAIIDADPIAACVQDMRRRGRCSGKLRRIALRRVKPCIWTLAALSPAEIKCGDQPIDSTSNLKAGAYWRALRPSHIELLQPARVTSLAQPRGKPLFQR
jgi:hypothetical protein